jgi:hypothetical protein
MHPNDWESYANVSISSQQIHSRQTGQGARQSLVPGPPSWNLSMGLMTHTQEKFTATIPQENQVR